MMFAISESRRRRGEVREGRDHPFRAQTTDDFDAKFDGNTEKGQRTVVGAGPLRLFPPPFGQGRFAGNILHDHRLSGFIDHVDDFAAGER